MKLQEALRQVLRFGASEHRRKLEAEVARLRAESRALLNSILGIAGVPPIAVAEADAVSAATALVSPATGARDGERAGTGGAGPVQAGRKLSNSNTGASAGKTLAASPTRKRSWQQIHRALEINAAKKKPPEEDR